MHVRPKSDREFVVFPDGSRFNVRFYMTTDVYAVELPCGAIEAPTLRGLHKKVKQEFEGVKIERVW